MIAWYSVFRCLVWFQCSIYGYSELFLFYYKRWCQCFNHINSLENVCQPLSIELMHRNLYQMALLYPTPTSTMLGRNCGILFEKVLNLFPRSELIISSIDSVNAQVMHTQIERWTDCFTAIKWWASITNAITKSIICIYNVVLNIKLPFSFLYFVNRTWHTGAIKLLEWGTIDSRYISDQLQ